VTCQLDTPLQKVLSVPNIISKSANFTPDVKTKVVAHIESARDDLKQQTEDLKNEDLIE
jgi:hypothetical protein